MTERQPLKVRQIVTKTIEAATAAALDTAVATYVRGLAEEDLIATHFNHISGSYVCCIVHTS